MANEQEITFDEPDEGRDIYHEPDDRALIRTKDVYQTELDDGVDDVKAELQSLNLLP